MCDTLVPARMYSVPGSFVREEKEAPRSVGRKITLAQPDFRPDSGTGTGSSPALGTAAGTGPSLALGTAAGTAESPALGTGAGTGSRSSRSLGAIAESVAGVGDEVFGMSSSSPASEVFLWGQAMHIISQLLTKVRRKRKGEATMCKKGCRKCNLKYIHQHRFSYFLSMQMTNRCLLTIIAS